MLCSSLPKWIILSMAAWLPPHSCLLAWTDSTSAEPKAAGLSLVSPQTQREATLLLPVLLLLLTHVGVAVFGLTGVLGAAVEEAVGGGFRHSVGEVVHFHVHVAAVGRRRSSSSSSVSQGADRGVCVC